MRRRTLLQAAGAATIGAAAPAAAQDKGARGDGKKVFRWALVGAETGFDPAQVSDLYSNYVIANVFDAPLQFDYLARPIKLRTKTAAAMPEVSSDFRTITVRIRPGIYFHDDPVFKGARRELVAADYVYSVKRIADPRWKSPWWGGLEPAGVLGLAELRKEAAAPGGRFDYDREIEGLRALDRYTFQIRLATPNPRFLEALTDPRPFGAVAREVVEAYPDEMMGRAVGTGPFKLVQWSRGSRIVLERNPAYRDEYYEAEPAPDDALGQTWLARLKGRKLPLVDRVELSIIIESQPRWLAFLNGQQDSVNVPLEYINIAVPNGQLAPSLQKRGIVFERQVLPDVVITYFNLDDPVVGGYTPDKVALRRAISLGYDIDEEIRLVRRGSMTRGHSLVPPLTTGYEPAFLSEMGQFDRARARALLDTFGYVDRDGDGWRENPDGSRLEILLTSETSQIDRLFNELWKRQLDALGLRVRFDIGPWPEHLKQARAGKLAMWMLGNSATATDPDAFLGFCVSDKIGSSNFARFRNARYDELYAQQRVMPDGPQRLALIDEMKRISVAYMPYKVHGHRYANDLSHARLIGYRRHPFARDFFKWIDVQDGPVAP